MTDYTTFRIDKTILGKLDEVSKKANLSKISILRQIINGMYELILDYDRVTFAVTPHKSGQAVGIILIPIEVWTGSFEDEKLEEDKVKQNE